MTVSCAEGDNGFVYEGILGFEEVITQLDEMPESPTKIMLNVGTPDQAFAFSKLPEQGRRAGAPRVRDQPADRHPPPRSAGLRHARAARCESEIAERIARVRLAARLLRAARRRGRLDDRAPPSRPSR